MKILHIVLSCFYVEGLGYQENLLPKYHKLLGNEVSVLTSVFPNSGLGDPQYRKCREYENKDSVRVIKLDRNEFHIFGKEIRLNRYKGVYEALERLQPDIIFIHGLTSFADLEIAKYLRKHRDVIAYADQHTDYYNAGTVTWKSRLILKLLWRPMIRRLQPFIKKFWGTTPWRCDYLEKVYRLPKEKIDLLVMGADDRKIDFLHREDIRRRICRELRVSEADFIIVSGGRIDRAKNIHLLMQTVQELNLSNLHLIVFGDPLPDTEKEFRIFEKCERIHAIGWIPAGQVYDYFLASDLAVFPGTHSVLWEQACACGIPCFFKDWEGMHHVDVGGNCIFLKEGTKEELKSQITEILEQPALHRAMKKAAVENGIKAFSYRRIAQRAIEEAQE